MDFLNHRGQDILQVEVSSQNVVKVYRSILVLHADVRYNLKVAKIKIPLYVMASGFPLTQVGKNI